MAAIWADLRSDTSGASAAEYAFVIALVAGIIIVSVGTLAPPINTIFNSMSAQMISVNNFIGK